MANPTKLVTTITIVKDVTVYIEGHTVLLKRNDKLTVERTLAPLPIKEMTRRLVTGETFYCGSTGCPGYTFEIDEPSHKDPEHNGVCAAGIEIEKKRQKEEIEESHFCPIEFRELAELPEENSE